MRKADLGIPLLFLQNSYLIHIKNILYIWYQPTVPQQLLLETSQRETRLHQWEWRVATGRNTCMAANTEALIHRRCRSELIRVTERQLEMSSGTYASRVQQVSPSTSPPGALSVLTDSFSLAGMLTGRERGTDRERERERCGKKEMDELTGEDSCISVDARWQVQPVLEKVRWTLSIGLYSNGLHYYMMLMPNYRLNYPSQEYLLLKKRGWKSCKFEVIEVLRVVSVQEEGGNTSGLMQEGWMRDWYWEEHSILLLLSVFACWWDWLLPLLAAKTLPVTSSGLHSQAAYMDPGTSHHEIEMFANLSSAST